MNHKIFFNGLIILLIQFFTAQHTFAVTYPITVNNNFTISAANQFDLCQTETVVQLQSRMKTLLQYSELFPTGFYVQAGTTLKVNVSVLGGSSTTGAKVVITDRYAGGAVGSYTQTVSLNNGNNNINVTKSGNVFISYSNTNGADVTRKLRFTFTDDGSYVKMPLFIKDQTTTAEWLDMLQNNAPTPDVMFIFKRGVMVLDRVEIDTYKNNDFNRIITALDDITDVEIAGSGIITTANQGDKNRDFGNLLYITSNNGSRVAVSNPHATNPGLVRVPIDWIATTNHIFSGGAWGISHEIGHHQQQNTWDWIGNVEVQVNIHTMLARNLIYTSEPGLDASDWRNAAFYLAKDNIGKDYNASGLDLKVKIPLFWQLQLAFGEGNFYKNFYTYVRENAVNSGSNDAEKLNFMKTANTISGKNLCDYFIQWGLNPTATHITTLNGMGLAAPNISPLTYSEVNLLENITPLRDTTVYQGQSVTYKVAAMAVNGVKKVEFYDGATKIGESISFPFQFTFTPTFGTHPITAKLIDGLDNAILTTDAVDVTVNRVTITSPADRSNYIVGDSYMINTQVVVMSGNAVQKVEFYDNEVKIGESSTAPYQFEVSSAQRGIHKLEVKAYYQQGEISPSAPVYINVGGLLANADSYVRDGSYAKDNYGTISRLVVKQDPNSSYTRYTFLKFKLSDLQQADFAMAKLKLNIDATNTAGANSTNWELYFVVDDTWQEEEIIYNNRPAAGVLLGSIRQASGAVTWDITSQLNTELAGDKYISLMLKSSTVGNYTGTFYSKESEQPFLQPVLELYTADEMPVVTTITSPSSTNWYQPDDNTVQINVSTTIKPSNPVTKVAFYLNGTILGETSTFPYQYTLNDMSRGVYELTAKAYYQDGTISDAEAVGLVVGGVAPEADSFVQGGSSANNGNDTKMTVKKDSSNPTYREAFLRFNLSDVTETSLGKTILKLNLTRTNSGVLSAKTWQLYFVNDDSWTETGITYANRPTEANSKVGNKMAEVPTVKQTVAPVLIEWDITSYVNAELARDKKISMVLRGEVNNGTGDADFASKENSNITLRPLLDLYTEDELKVLPVKLVSFTAKATAQGVQLNWQVASEINHKQYVISHSTDGVNFAVIGTSTTHSFLDRTATSGTYYYNLSQEDNEGKLGFLASSVVNVGLNDGVRVFPNPTKDTVAVSFSGSYSAYLVTDMQGKIVTQGSIGKEAVGFYLDLSGVASGTFVMKLTGANGSTATRIIKL